MEIQNKKDSKHTKPARSSSLFDDDFASGFEDSKFEKFKPLVKVLVALVVITGIGYGAYVYLGSKADDTARTAHTSEVEGVEMSPLEQCVDKAWNDHETPKESDPDFYPKLIAGYDAQLACYDAHPDDEKSAANRLSIESVRKSAIDSSDEYKDTYLANNPYEYTPSTSSGSYQHTSPSTSGGSSNTSSNSSVNNSHTPPPSSSQPAVDTQWCSAKKSEVDGLYVSYQEARNKVNAIDTQLRNISTARPPGFTGTQSQLDAWRASERQRLTTEKTPLVTRQNNAYASYNAAQSEYRNKPCY